MKSLLAGFSLVRQGLTLITQPGLRRYAILPVLINVIVFVLCSWWLLDRFGVWLDALPLLDRLGDSRISAFITGVLKFVFGTALFIISIFTFTAIANLIASPFNSLLAEQVEARLIGAQVQSPGWSELIASISRTIGSELRKLLYLFLWLIPLTLLHFAPLLQIAAPFLILLFGAWMFAIEYLDYAMGNHGLGFREVRRQARQHRGTALGFGFAVALISAIPILNLVAMPVAVAGATAMWVKFQKKDSDRG